MSGSAAIEKTIWAVLLLVSTPLFWAALGSLDDSTVSSKLIPEELNGGEVRPGGRPLQSLIGAFLLPCSLGLLVFSFGGSTWYQVLF